MKPITICGGGLAGLSLGIALRRQEVPVTLHEAGTYPRHRVCGEFINGVTNATLNHLGINEELADAQQLRSTVWSLNGRAIFQDTLQDPARGISRFELDQRLAAHFEKLGGNLKTVSRQRRAPAEGLVWAAGRIPDPRSRWIGLKVHVYGLPLKADLEMHLGSRGYVGLASVEGNRVNVCGLFERRDIVGRGHFLLQDYLFANGLDALQQRLEEVEHDPDSFVGVSAFALGAQNVDESLLTLGDSENMIPPFTGNGMSMAFESAETASVVLAEYADAQRDWPTTVLEIRKRLADRFRTRIAAARLLHPFLLGEVGRTLLSTLSRFGILPFGPLSRLLK